MKTFIIILFLISSAFKTHTDNAAKNLVLTSINVKILSNKHNLSKKYPMNDSLFKRIDNCKIELWNGATKTIVPYKNTQETLMKNLTDSTKLILNVFNKQYKVDNFAKYICNEGTLKINVYIDTLAINNTFWICGNFYCNDRLCSTEINDTLKRYNILEISNNAENVFFDGKKVSHYEYFKLKGRE